MTEIAATKQTGTAATERDDPSPQPDSNMFTPPTTTPQTRITISWGPESSSNLPNRNPRDRYNNFVSITMPLATKRQTVPETTGQCTTHAAQAPKGVAICTPMSPSFWVGTSLASTDPLIRCSAEMRNILTQYKLQNLNLKKINLESDCAFCELVKICNSFEDICNQAEEILQTGGSCTSKLPLSERATELNKLLTRCNATQSELNIIKNELAEVNPRSADSFLKLKNVCNELGDICGKAHKLKTDMMKEKDDANCQGGNPPLQEYLKMVETPSTSFSRALEDMADIMCAYEDIRPFNVHPESLLTGLQTPFFL